jgi:hypothetical protein
VTGIAGKAPLAVKATLGEPLSLDAAGTRDPDGDTLIYRWFSIRGPVPAFRSTARVTVTPHVAGTAHIILAVEDNGSPTLTSYRRVILTIRGEIVC